MKKKDYENKNINDLTASEASHMYTWVLVKAFFITSLISILIMMYISFCMSLYIENKYGDILNTSLKELQIEKGSSGLNGESTNTYDLPQIYLDDIEE